LKGAAPIVFLRLVALLSSFTVLLVSAVPAPAQQPLRIGASLSLTGTYAKPGLYGREGYALCQKHLNEGAGVLGRPIEFVIYDDRSDPQTGVRLYEKLITEDRVEAVLGPYSSAITEAVANVTEKYRKLLLAPLGSAGSIWEKGRRYVIMMVSPAEAYLDGLLDLAARNGLKSVALIYEDTLFPKTSMKGAMASARKRGLEIVFQEAYPKAQTDFAALLTKIRAIRPDVLAAATYFDDVVAITRQMKELDVNVRMFGTTVGGDLPEFYKALGRTGEYVYGASQWEPSLPYTGAREFTATYEAEYNRTPSYHAAAAYSACMLLAEAINRTGSLDPDRLRDYLFKLQTITAFGGFDVDERGYQVGHRMVTIQWQEGRQVVVWPDEVSGGKIRFPTPPWSQR
jgi:branched-chain amino acid transport system substrate-binding protein